MARNTLADVNDHLFMALERLNDEDVSPEELELEVQRSKAITNIANAIIQNANTVLKAYKARDEAITDAQLPRMLNG